MSERPHRKPVPPCRTFLEIQKLRPPNAPGHGYDYFAGCEAAPFEDGAAQFSLANAWWLAELSLLSYVRETAAIERELSKTPFRVLRFLRPWARAPVKGFVLEGARSLVAVFRGTDVLDPLDWIHDLDSRWMRFGGKARVHAGFARAFDAADPLATIERALDADPRPVFLAGHSLGGAVAQLAAARLGEHGQGADCQLYTFGAPRAGDRAFVELLPDRHVRVVHHRDPVPRVPPFRGFAHGGSVLWLDARGRPAPVPRGLDGGTARRLLEFATGASRRGGPLDPLTPGLLRPFADHMPILYALHLWNAVADRRAAQAKAR